MANDENHQNGNDSSNNDEQQQQQQQQQLESPPPGSPISTRTGNADDSNDDGNDNGNDSVNDISGNDALVVPSTPMTNTRTRMTMSRTEESSPFVPSTPASASISASVSASASRRRILDEDEIVGAGTGAGSAGSFVPSTPADNYARRTQTETQSQTQTQQSRNDNNNNDDRNSDSDAGANDDADDMDDASASTPLTGYGSYGASINSPKSRTSRSLARSVSPGRSGNVLHAIRNEGRDENDNENDNVDDNSMGYDNLNDDGDGAASEDKDGRGMRSQENNDNTQIPSTSNGNGNGNTRDENNNDNEEMFEGEETSLIRGTDIHVRTAAKTFKEFLQNFISVETSQKKLRKEARAKRKKAKAKAKRRSSSSGAGDGGDGGGDDSSDDEDMANLSSDDDDSLSSFDTTDSTQEDKFVYLDKLRDILLGRSQNSASGSGSSGDNNNQSESMTSSTAIATTGTVPFDLDAFHLYFHSPQSQRLYHQLISYPSEVIPLMDLVISREIENLLRQLHEEAEVSSDPDMYATLYPLDNDIPLPKVQVRPFNLNTISHMRALDPNSIDNLLSIRGMVVRTSPIIPDLKVAHFACTICSHAIPVTLDRGRISEPTVCPTCNVKNGFELVHNRSLFADKQMVRIQETPNEVPAGETPASIVLFAYDDLVDAVRPGDRVEVTGVFRAQARRVNPKISKVKSVYKTYLDVIHFKRVNGESRRGIEKKAQETETNDGKGTGSALDHIDGKLSPDRIQQLEEMARSPDIYDRLVNSLAPSIWGLDDVKKGVLCMLFGGNSKRVKKGTAERKQKQKQDDSYDSEFSDEDDGGEDGDGNDNGNGSTSKLNKRGDINILLCGDPGTSKSQLLSYVHKLSPRGVYTSGKGSSAVGLTASIVRDPETRDLVLESGALVLSDLGICCIDEFDKMSDTTRAILHEAMEQQTVSIAKAGIIATLNARTSILASANPVESRYNPQLSVVDNIKLPPTLLSRFDLIYLVLDAPNVEGDRRLAQHLVGLYYETPNVIQPPLDQSFLRDYIAYARDNIFPELTDLATKELIMAYLEMRKMGSSSGGNNGSRTISATPRQLESLIRLSEGIAKMRFSRLLERSDVREAVRLMKVATQAAATDPRTGRIDMDMITTGRSTANREMEEALNLSLKELLAERRGNRMAVVDVRRQLTEIMNITSIKQEDVMEALRLAEGDGLIQLNERAQTIFVRAGLVA